MDKPDEEGMSKFGVDETLPEEKLAFMQYDEQGNATCPLCKQKAERHGSVFICPTHGTEPFEK